MIHASRSPFAAHIKYINWSKRSEKETRNKNHGIDSALIFACLRSIFFFVGCVAWTLVKSDNLLNIHGARTKNSKKMRNMFFLQVFFFAGVLVARGRAQFVFCSIFFFNVFVLGLIYFERIYEWIRCQLLWRCITRNDSFSFFFLCFLHVRQAFYCYYSLLSLLLLIFGVDFVVAPLRFGLCLWCSAFSCGFSVYFVCSVFFFSVCSMVHKINCETHESIFVVTIEPDASSKLHGHENEKKKMESFRTRWSHLCIGSIDARWSIRSALIGSLALADYSSLVFCGLPNFRLSIKRYMITWIVPFTFPIYRFYFIISLSNC